MKQNPYGKVQFSQPTVATELRFPGSRERAVGRNGEVNASSTPDLLRQIAKLIEASKTSNIITEEVAITKQETAKLHREMLMAAFTGPMFGEAHKELGEVLAEELYQASNREGFMRRFFARQDLSNGQIPQIRMRMKNVVATVAAGPSQVQQQLIRDNLFYPPEFYISARPFVEQREIVQSVGDVLEEKYIEGLEAIMVSEDRTWYSLATQQVNISNPFTTVIGVLNPNALANVRTLITRWNLPATNFLLASDLWADIIGDAGWSGNIDPVSKHELLLSGQLGLILGMNAITDAFRHPQHKVLNQGEFFIISDAVNHGMYTDRGGVDSAPIDGSIERIPGRGWWMTETVSQVLANSRSVAKAQRV